MLSPSLHQFSHGISTAALRSTSSITVAAYHIPYPIAIPVRYIHEPFSAPLHPYVTRREPAISEALAGFAEEIKTPVEVFEPGNAAVQLGG